MPGSANDSSSDSDCAAPASAVGSVLARDDLLALVSHELRNPLHGMSLQMALLRSLTESKGIPEVAERVRKVQSALTRYAERVTVLMELILSPTHEYPLRLTDLDIVTVLQSVVDSLEPEARNRQIALHFSTKGDCAARSDRVALEQVVDNLLLNAFKHSGATNVTLRLRCEADTAVLEVLDDGHGISEADQSRIFDKYGVASATPRGTGTGLGLWIVRRLVAALDGKITLQSAPGQGTTFTVSLPLTSAVPTTRATP